MFTRMEAAPIRKVQSLRNVPFIISCDPHSSLHSSVWLSSLQSWVPSHTCPFLMYRGVPGQFIVIVNIK